MSQEEDLFALWADRARAAQPPEPEPAPEPHPPTTAAAATREQRRSRRKREVRSHTITRRQLDPAGRRAEEREYHPIDETLFQGRPRTRADCEGGERPCPWVSCKYHLYLEVLSSGGVKLIFPDLEVWELAESCAIDVAERGNGEGVTLEEVGALLNITRERVRQIEVKGLAKLRRADERAEGLLAETAEDEGYGRAVRRLPVLTNEDTDEEDDETGEATEAPESGA